MIPIPVTSRIIKSVEFGRSDGRLRLRFASGEERVFTGVPATAVQELVEAPSPGRHYIEHVRQKFRRCA